MILWIIVALVGMGLMLFGIGVGGVADEMSDLYGFCRMVAELGAVLLVVDTVILFIMYIMEII